MNNFKSCFYPFLSRSSQSHWSSSRSQSRRLKPRHFQGPVIANVIPGVWMFTNSHSPSGLKQAPAHSFWTWFPVKVTFGLLARIRSENTLR